MRLVTEKQLREATEDVADEIYLFHAACVELRKQRPSRLAWQCWYVLARNLMDFFDTTPRRRDGDELLAADYFQRPEDWHTRRNELARPADYERYKVAAHKIAAHLTYGRQRYRQKGSAAYPPSPEVSNHLAELSRLFLASLDQDPQDWFRATEFWLPWR